MLCHSLEIMDYAKEKNNKKGKKTTTTYRIHSNNMANFKKCFSSSRALKLLSINLLFLMSDYTQLARFFIAEKNVQKW